MILQISLFTIESRLRSKEIIYSLNQLKDIYPAAYQQSEKYQGRESQVNQPIPDFEFSWNDLIHTAPISPKLIMEGLLKAGVVNQCQPRRALSQPCSYDLDLQTLNVVAKVAPYP